jgi:LysR family transcriptional regulator, hydrogen peroxide-inducible genes activator
MTLQELRYLVAVSEEGQVARAAERCHVGQPTLSTQLKKLESTLGVQLFERGPRGLTPTAAGESIIAQARIVLDEVEKLRDLAHTTQDPMAGALRVGAIPTLGPYLLPHLLPAIRKTYPKLRLLLSESLTAQLLEALHGHMLDAALVALPVAHEGLETMELFREPFELALPAGHRLTKKKHAQPQDLADENLLLLAEGHCLRDQALEVCGTDRRESREEVRATSLETLRQMVAAGIGCTLMPQLSTQGGARPDKRLVELRPFARPAPTRLIGLVWRARAARAEAVRQLGTLIRSHLPSGVFAIRAHTTVPVNRRDGVSRT